MGTPYFHFKTAFCRVLSGGIFCKSGLEGTILIESGKGQEGRL